MKEEYVMLDPDVIDFGDSDSEYSFLDDLIELKNDIINKIKNKNEKDKNGLYKYNTFTSKKTFSKNDINIEGLINLYISYSNLLKQNMKNNRILIDDLYMTNIFLDNSMILQFNVKNEEVDKFTKYDISIKVLNNELKTKDEIICVDKDVMLTANPYRKRLLKYNTSIESLYSFIELIDTLDEEKILENHDKLNYIKEENEAKLYRSGYEHLKWL